MFLLDSEGKDSLVRDRKHDAKLMSIINVLSSVFVVNVKGIMDLEEFYILDTIAYFSMKLFKPTNDDELDHEKEDESVQKIDYKTMLTPNLVILMRDFDLLLEDSETGQPITENQ